MRHALISAGVPLFAVAVYGIGLFLFISVVWSKWYPVLQNKLNPTLVKWVFKFMLNGLAGFGGYMYAHYYLNSLTGGRSEQFSQDTSSVYGTLRGVYMVDIHHA